MRIFQLLWVLVALVAVTAASGQTRVDLRTQSKSVDFSSATTTKPVRTGSILPSTCSPGEMFFKTDAIPGQNLQMCTVADSWTAIMGSGGGVTGGAATATAQLLDFQVTQLNANTLGIGLSCTQALPCSVRFGNHAVSFVNGATVTLSGTPTGVVFFYIDSQGILVAGHNLTGVTCSSGCVSQTNVTSIPANAIPVAAWTVTSGTWDTNGGTDFRGYLSTKNVAPGAGLMATEVNGLTTISVDATVISFRVGIPATATTACTQGSWAADASFYYACVSTNTWRRTAISSW